jgi:hypothetical protein
MLLMHKFFSSWYYKNIKKAHFWEGSRGLDIKHIIVKWCENWINPQVLFTMKLTEDMSQSVILVKSPKVWLSNNSHSVCFYGLKNNKPYIKSKF